MKKLLVIIILILVNISYSQLFLTPKGIIDTTTGNKYTILKYDSISCNELYKATYSQLLKINPLIKIKSEMENDFIEAEFKCTGCTDCLKNGWASIDAPPCRFDVRYYFKDGKIKVEIVHYFNAVKTKFGNYSITLDNDSFYSIYDDDWTIKNQEMYNHINRDLLLIVGLANYKIELKSKDW